MRRIGMGMQKGNNRMTNTAITDGSQLLTQARRTTESLHLLTIGCKATGDFQDLKRKKWSRVLFKRKEIIAVLISDS